MAAAAVVKSPTNPEVNHNPLTSPISEGSFKAVHSNYVPAQMEKHLQFLDFNRNGDLILGSSSLNTRYWTGSLWYYKSGTEPSDVTNPEMCVTGVDMETGVLDGRFVRDDQIVVGLDSGAVVMVTLTKEEDGDRIIHHLEQFSPHMDGAQHDDMLTGLDTWTRDSSVATCGLDNRVCVYNPALTPVHVYSPVHEGHVVDISCNQNNTHVFATCSRNVDTCVRVWDTRQPKPARTVTRLPDTCPPSSVAWVGDNKLVVGTMTGHVYLVDTDTCTMSLSTCVGDRPVYKLRVSPDNNKVAVAMDDAVVNVVKINGDNLEILMNKDTCHRDYVRGLAWSDPSTLWSAAWDHSVVKHKL